MTRAIRRRLGKGSGSQAGMTLIEMLIASAMGILLMGAVGTMVVSVMRTQPEVSGRSENVSTARWVLERLTREIRNGVAVDEATASKVSFRTMVRRTECGGAPPTGTAPATECQVTYACASTSCTRTETAPGVMSGGTPSLIFKGIDDPNVFTYSPAVEPTYIGVTLRLPNPEGPANLTVTDGASLRNATLDN